MSAAALLVWLTAWGPAAPEVPAEARAHDDRGLAYIEGGDAVAGVAELERAYALMPDPLRYRVGRSEVLGSLRGALTDLYEATGDAGHLRRLHVHLLRHLEALIVALGDGVTADDVAGTLVAVRKVEQQLARVPQVIAAPPRPVPRPRSVVPRPAPAMPAAGEGPTRRQLYIAGGVSVGIGAVLLGVMAYGIAQQQGHGAAGWALKDRIDGRSITPAERAELVGHLEGAHANRRLALATGLSSAGVSVLGVALLAHGRRRPDARERKTGVSLAPWWVQAGVGVTLLLPLR
ncbi:MAG TPA: hypothetical protein VGB85_27160 [Nannocystis sp.]